MSRATDKQTLLKRWNIGLKVSPEEEKIIKMEAIRQGMGISEYVKQTLLENLSVNKVLTGK
ncbi:MAG: hypothetical protein ACFBSE_14385 [Prochloraceae cyanobacterium]